MSKRKVRKVRTLKKRSDLPLVVPDFFGTDEDVQRWIDVAYDVRVTRPRAFPGWVRAEYVRLFGEYAPTGMEWELIKARIITYLENKRKGELHGEALRNYKWVWSTEAARNKTYGFSTRLRGTFLFEHKKTEDAKMASAKEIVDIIEKKPAKKKAAPKKKATPKNTKDAKKKTEIKSVARNSYPKVFGMNARSVVRKLRSLKFSVLDIQSKLQDLGVDMDERIIKNLSYGGDSARKCAKLSAKQVIEIMGKTKG